MLSQSPASVPEPGASQGLFVPGSCSVDKQLVWLPDRIRICIYKFEHSASLFSLSHRCASRYVAIDLVNAVEGAMPLT